MKKMIVFLLVILSALALQGCIEDTWLNPGADPVRKAEADKINTASAMAVKAQEAEIAGRTDVYAAQVNLYNSEAATMIQDANTRAAAAQAEAEAAITAAEARADAELMAAQANLEYQRNWGWVVPSVIGLIILIPICVLIVSYVGAKRHMVYFPPEPPQMYHQPSGRYILEDETGRKIKVNLRQLESERRKRLEVRR
jgi:hypothetical protein